MMSPEAGPAGMRIQVRQRPLRASKRGLEKLPEIRHIIAIGSGKGGAGKIDRVRSYDAWDRAQAPI